MADPVLLSTIPGIAPIILNTIEKNKNVMMKKHKLSKKDTNNNKKPSIEQKRFFSLMVINISKTKIFKTIEVTIGIVILPNLLLLGSLGSKLSKADNKVLIAILSRSLVALAISPAF